MPIQLCQLDINYLDDLQTKFVSRIPHNVYNTKQNAVEAVTFI